MAAERVLIVDDEKNIVASLKDILAEEGYEVAVAGNGLDALEKIQTNPPDLVLLDIWLPGMDGIEVLKSVKSYHPEIEVLVMSGHGTIDTAVKATKLGAYDFIEKPFSLDHLTQSIENVLKQKKKPASRGEKKLPDPEELPLCFEMMVEVKKSTHKAAQTNDPVLLLGEKGAGKEFIAHAIHRRSMKSDRPFIKLNCAVIKVQEIQAQLFARNTKSDTSRSSNKAPAKKSDKVVYLSHVDALSDSLQEKLASALTQDAGKDSRGERGFLPARLYASSSEDLHSLAEKGRFNSSLLSVFKESTLEIPPLRQFTANIPVMIKDFFEELSSKGQMASPEIDEEAMEALCGYDWPGNVKELRTVLNKAFIIGAPQGKITLQELPKKIRESKVEIQSPEFEDVKSLKEAGLTWEKSFIIHHLRKHDWDLAKTCKALKASQKEFKEKLHRHSIRLPDKNGKHPEKYHHLQRTLKRSVVLCGSGLHSGIKTGLILQPLPPGSGIIFGDISSGKTIPARLENVLSTDYSTCLKKGMVSVATIEHIMAVLHMYRITNLLIKIGDEAPVMDGSAKDFCELIEDGEFEEQDGIYDELVIDKVYSFGSEENAEPHISIEPSDTFKVSYHMEYPKPIGRENYTFECSGEQSFKTEIAPARTFGFLEDVAQLTKMGFASGGKLDNFILLGDGKVLNTKLRFKNEFSRHKILDILGDFYLLGRPIRGHIKAHKTGHTQNIGLLKLIQKNLIAAA